MGIISPRLAQATIEICEKLYEEGGLAKVCDYANKVNLQYSQCDPCDTHTPTISTICSDVLDDSKSFFVHTCAACGQPKQK